VSQVRSYEAWLICSLTEPADQIKIRITGLPTDHHRQLRPDSADEPLGHPRPSPGGLDSELSREISANARSPSAPVAVLGDAESG
jgi:hypothetical protein